ncbi:hypothetical protein FPL11_07890 [Spiribacter aquaticus]|uniref:DUF4175 domain-containing protein n=1 Tax=Spiribacter aquaticus TaxID=1935996 RepID=A0A557RHA2_9GAMM|nr:MULTISPECIES: hypothetical protein [Spiribacter]KAF0280689.1 hypothetical protein BA897_08465 [Spiribacter roseus]TVO64560.1 hypothetical protein FPL11_07890 [Spiribacter aquaticus]
MSDYRRRGNRTLAWLALAIVLAYAVPYGLLRDQPVWHGAFLVWLVFGAVAIGLIARLVSGWRP